MRSEEEFIEKVKFIYDQSVLAIIANLLNGAIVFFILRDFFSIPILATWYSGIVLVIIYRSIISNKFKKEQDLTIEKAKFFDKLFLISTILSGSVWGSIAIFLFPNSLPHQSFLIFVLAGTAAGGSSAYVANFRYAFLFINLTIAPIGLKFLTIYTEIHLAMGFMCFLFIGFLLSSSKKSYVRYCESLKQKLILGEVEVNGLIQKKTAKFKSSFTAQIAHEIKTPLTGVIGMLDVLSKSKNLSSEELKHVNVALNSSDQLTRSVNDLLDLSMLQSGNLGLIKTETNLPQIIDRTKTLYSIKCAEKNNTIQVQIDKAIKKRIETDGIKISQIINNLVANANKRTLNGSLKIEANLLEDKKTFQIIDIIVQDNGKALSQEAIHTIFSKKFEESANTENSSDLGLQIARELIELFDSKLEITNNSDGNNELKFRLEVTKSKESYQTITPTTTESTHFDLQILYAEDNFVNQQVAKLLLEDIGCKVDIVINGEEAVKAIELNPQKYDLILMDIQMPIMNGIQATKKLKQDHKNLPPIIALSANSEKENKTAYLKEGLDDFMAKPIKTSSLVTLLKRYFNEKA